MVILTVAAAVLMVLLLSFTMYGLLKR